MRKYSIELKFENFFSRINWYTNLLVKVTEAESLTLEAEEKKEIFEAFVLKIYGLWESFVEEILVDCLSRDTSQYAKQRNTSLPKHLSRKVCSCLLSGLSFFDFRDVSDLKGKAKSILVSHHNPFQEISADHARKIDEFRIMRNYIAHRSDAARQRLKRMYSNRYRIARFREPGDFLLSKITHGPLSGEVRFAGFIDSFIKAVNEMAKAIGA